MTDFPLRHRIARDHPAAGEGHRILDDDDLLRATDETNCVSTLLSYRGSPWLPVLPGWGRDLGKPIGVVCDQSRDADGPERIFRRRKS